MQGLQKGCEGAAAGLYGGGHIQGLLAWLYQGYFAAVIYKAYMKGTGATGVYKTGITGF